MYKTAAVLAACSLLFAGCKNREVRPQRQERPVAPTAPRVLDSAETQAAVDALCDVLARRNEEGWPAQVLTRGLPVVRVLKIEDQTSGLVSAAGVRDALIDRLVNRRLAHVLGTDADLDAVWLERDYAKAGVTKSEIPSGSEDPAALVIRGELTSEPAGRDRIHVTLQLRAIDTVKSQVVASARRSFDYDVPADRVGMAEVAFHTGYYYTYHSVSGPSVRLGSDSLAQGRAPRAPHRGL